MTHLAVAITPADATVLGYHTIVGGPGHRHPRASRRAPR
jgi:hypothetical protein